MKTSYCMYPPQRTRYLPLPPPLSTRSFSSYLPPSAPFPDPFRNLTLTPIHEPERPDESLKTSSSKSPSYTSLLSVSVHREGERWKGRIVQSLIKPKMSRGTLDTILPISQVHCEWVDPRRTAAEPNFHECLGCFIGAAHRVTFNLGLGPISWRGPTPNKYKITQRSHLTVALHPQRTRGTPWWGREVHMEVQGLHVTRQLVMTMTKVPHTTPAKGKWPRRWI